MKVLIPGFLNWEYFTELRRRTTGWRVKPAKFRAPYFLVEELELARSNCI